MDAQFQPGSISVLKSKTDPTHPADGQLVGESDVTEGRVDSPVSNAIIHRLANQRPALLARFGPEAVMAAVDEVAEWVGDVDEIGSSDVSGWVADVERYLRTSAGEGIAEANPNQQISRYNPDGNTYKGSANKMPVLDPQDPVHNADRFGPEHDEPYEQDDYDKAELRSILAKQMESLSKVQRIVIKARFYDDMTFDQIANRLGITTERVRQIEAAGLRTLLHPNRSNVLRAFAEQGVAEGKLNETRDQLWTWVQSKFPKTQWPEYVQRDFLYAKAKGNQNQKDLEDFLDEIQRDFGRVRWQLEKLPITLDVFTPKTQRMIKEREGGSSNPYQVPKDAERHALQQKMIQQKGVSQEPIIVAKLSNGYDLIEGWHRTIQHLKAFPQGYTGPAWVCTGATYKSESVEQGAAEGKKHVSPSGVETNMAPSDDDYDINYGKNGVVSEFRKAQGVAEGRAGVDDTDTVGFSVNSEAAYTAVMKRFGDYIDQDETSGVMYAPARVWPRIEMVAFDADGEGAVRDDGVAENDRSEMDTPEFQRALSSVKKKAAQGPMTTVYDPKTRKYKVVPVNTQGK
jgi:RNA polymerase sigma factor (sigma-70 family)